MQKTELFLDDEMVSHSHNLETTVVQPKKCANNPIIISEYPWEKDYVTVYGSVLKADDSDIFRMWYMAGAGKDQAMCYAESDDGIKWHKPLMPITPYQTHHKTNILMGPDINIHGPCVIRNPECDNSEEKYLVYFDSYSYLRPTQKELHTSDRWTFTATSPDGIHWFPRQGVPAVAGKSDTGQSVVWMPEHQCYYAFMRGVLDHDGTRVRYVRRAQSSDFKKWSHECELLRADTCDGAPMADLHQLSVTRYCDIYIGLLSVFHIDEIYSTDKYPIFEEGTCDTQLVVSRDGNHWHRVADRQVFLPLGNDGEWDSQWLVTASQFVVHNDTIFIYYASTDKTRSEGHHYQIGLAQLPVGRFVSRSPAVNSEEGILELKPQHYSLDNFIVNANAENGRIDVELRTIGGQVLDGFSRHDCKSIVGDNLAHDVRWNKGDLGMAVSAYQGPIRVRFYLHRSQLYSFQYGLKNN